jgi:hypothetical protein
MPSSIRFVAISVCAALLVSINCCNAAQEPADVPGDLLTVAEASSYEATSASFEVNRFLKSCDDRADHVRHFEFGRTSLDQPLPGAVFANPLIDNRPTDGRLVVMLLGNIHSGECDGKEALLMLARELTLNEDHPWLKKLVIVIVPNYNADGNDDMSADNRPGQIGPLQGMGRRETAQGFDLNRDFIKLDTPEAKALVRLIHKWNPHVFIDCHTTNGSIHRYPLTYDVPHNPASPQVLRDFLRQKMMPDVTARMKAVGFDTFYYGNFTQENSRWESYGFEPRYSTEYLGLRGRIGILSESYSYADYKTRVLASREFVRHCVESTIAESGQIASLLQAIEVKSTEVAENRAIEFVSLDAEMTPFMDKVTVLGRLPDSDEPKDYEVEFWANFQSTKEVRLPFAYAISEASEPIIANLKTHGLQIDVLSKPLRTEVTVRTIKSLQQNARPFQSHHLVRLTTTETRRIHELPEGTVIIHTAQPLGRLAAWLLEPESSDGLVTWNFFDDTIEEGAEFPVLTLDNAIQLPTTRIE